MERLKKSSERCSVKEPPPSKLEWSKKFVVPSLMLTKLASPVLEWLKKLVVSPSLEIVTLFPAVAHYPVKYAFAPPGRTAGHPPPTGTRHAGRARTRPDPTSGEKRESGVSCDQPVLLPLPNGLESSAPRSSPTQTGSPSTPDPPPPTRPTPAESSTTTRSAST